MYDYYNDGDDRHNDGDTHADTPQETSAVVHNEHGKEQDETGYGGTAQRGSVAKRSEKRGWHSDVRP